MQLLATTDGLTGLYNHRYFQEHLLIEIERSQRYEQRRPVSLVMMDIDGFKSVNDQYGHRVGDRILQRVATLIRRKSRKVDICCRYGGEEFTVILPEIGRQKAARFAERVRNLIESKRIDCDGESCSVTISAGVSSYPDDGETPSDLIDKEDQVMYWAKGGGKNKVGVCRADGGAEGWVDLEDREDPEDMGDPEDRRDPGDRRDPATTEESPIPSQGS